MATAQSIIDLAASKLGNVGGHFCKQWYADLVGNQYFARDGVSWCAMFASWVFNVCGQPLAGAPAASCGVIMAAADKEGACVDVRSARAGDVVIFDRHVDSQGHDHVGIVTENLGDAGIRTIEGNASNTVAARTRPWDSAEISVQRIIRPAYDGAEVPEPTPSTRVPEGCIDPAETILAYDNYFGSLTTEYVQRALRNHGFYPAGVYVIDGDFAKYTKQELQKFLKFKGFYDLAIDGDFGYWSVCALQKYLISLGCYWKAGYGICDVDGQWGDLTTTAIQRAINAGVL